MEVKRPPDRRLWTRKLIQDVVDTLLHEMTHAFLMIYAVFVPSSGAKRTSMETEGLTGHGPRWVTVAVAVAAEADRSLGGEWDRWDLEIAEARFEEREALRRSYCREGLDRLD